MKAYADKKNNSAGQAAANSFNAQRKSSKSAFQVVDNRPETAAQRIRRELVNNGLQVQQLISYQNMADSSSSKQHHPIQRQSNQVIQRITEEDSRQAVYNIRESVERHGYTVDGIRSILQHRYSEIIPGYGNRLAIGLGAEEGNTNQGCIIYDCTLNRDGTYTIDAFHAHGGQLEGSRRGY